MKKKEESDKANEVQYKIFKLCYITHYFIISTSYSDDTFLLIDSQLLFDDTSTLISPIEI